MAIGERNIARIELVVISFIALYFEVLFIRWLSSEIRVFAYFKNFPLIAAFLGLGLGCAVAKKTSVKNNLIIVGTFVILVFLVTFSESFKLTHLFFPDPAIYQWRGSIISPNLIPILKGYPVINIIVDIFPKSVVLFLVASIFMAIIFIIFYLVVIFFYQIGLVLGEKLNMEKSPIMAYSLNILGSLFGTVAFSLISYYELQPIWWILIGSIFILFIFRNSFVSVTALFIIIILSGIIVTNKEQKVVWSPYYRIEYKGLYSQDSKKDEHRLLGYEMSVNHDYLQRILDLSDGMVKRFPDELLSFRQNYDLPYEVTDNMDRVLIVGAGAGNDTAAAIRRGAKYVEAVEIDPAIIRLGVQLHPENPYRDNRVRLIANDARIYFHYAKQENKVYDLIVYGLLDSHAALSSMSSVRLEFFVYTVESFKDALKLLDKNHGLAVVSFSVGWKDWVGQRIYNTMKEAFGMEPVCVLNTGYDAGVTFIAGPGLKSQKFQERLKSLKVELVNDRYGKSDVRISSDDWPFLYNKPRTLPIAYIIALLIIILSGAFITKRLLIDRFRDSYKFNWHMFFMGAAFLLVETKGIAHISLLFGATWVVNSAVFISILIMILIANLISAGMNIKNNLLFYIFLWFSLLAGYFVTPTMLNELPHSVAIVAGSLLIALPVLFAGIIFATAFKRTKNAHADLGVNMLGAIIGGSLEATSLAIGIKSLALLAIILYFLSYYALKFRAVEN